MHGSDLIGWLSSVILVATIAKQIHKQWRDHTSEGVSKWLFLGQLAASTGFTIYSALVHNWVFVVTNALMLVNALIGFGVVLHHRRHCDTCEANVRQSSRQPSREGSRRALVS